MIANEVPKPSSKQRAPEIGFLSPGVVERAFIVVIYAGIFVLALLSVFGSFYGVRSLSATFDPPWKMVLDAIDAPQAFGLGLGVQIVLTLAQYGGRVRAGHDRRWWVVYVIALVISVYYNVQAYWTPLTGIAPPILAVLIIVLADILPEFTAMKR